MEKYVIPFPKKKIPKGGEFGNTILFDGTKRPNPHRGVDFAVPAGSPIKSVSDGKVVTNKESDVLGHYVVVEDLKGTFWGYCHLRAPGAKVGTVCVAGETVIGKVGNTGSASHGAHLHMTQGPSIDSVIWGKVNDPVEIIEKRNAKNAAKAAPVVAEAPAVEAAPVVVDTDAAESVPAPVAQPTIAKKKVKK